MSSPTATEVENVRIECTLDPDDATTLPELVIAYQWGGAGTVLMTAARCCEWLAGRSGTTAFRWSADGTSVDKTMQAPYWRKRASELWARADAASSSGGVIAIAHAEAGGSASDDEFSAEP